MRSKKQCLLYGLQTLNTEQKMNCWHNECIHQLKYKWYKHKDKELKRCILHKAPSFLQFLLKWNAYSIKGYLQFKRLHNVQYIGKYFARLN